MAGAGAPVDHSLWMIHKKVTRHHLITVPGYGLDDDQYNVYDQPWRKGGGSAANTIYRPKKDLDSDLYGDNVEEYTKNKRWEKM